MIYVTKGLENLYAVLKAYKDHIKHPEHQQRHSEKERIRIHQSILPVYTGSRKDCHPH